MRRFLSGPDLEFKRDLELLKDLGYTREEDRTRTKLGQDPDQHQRDVSGGGAQRGGLCVFGRDEVNVGHQRPETAAGNEFCSIYDSEATEPAEVTRVRIWAVFKPSHLYLISLCDSFTAKNQSPVKRVQIQHLDEKSV